MAALDEVVERLGGEIEYARLGDELSDGFNEYFNALGPERWPAGGVRLELRRRGFRMRVGGEPWGSALGATLRCYFLTAYHFALARLTGRDGYMFPGFVVMDYPPTLADGTQLSGHEDYLIEPFLRLSELGRQQGIQVIAAGQGFSDLPGARWVRLSRVWTSATDDRADEA